MKKLLVTTLCIICSCCTQSIAQSEEDTSCINPFFERNVDISFLRKFFSEDSVASYSQISRRDYVKTLKTISKEDTLLVHGVSFFLKQLKDTIMYFDNTQVSMASRDCEGGVYFFKTTIKKYWRVLALNGEPRILVSGGYIIKPYNVNSFDAYYMVGSRVVQVELETPKNDHVWIGTDIPR